MSTPIGGANGTDRVWQRAEPRERGKPSNGPNLTDVAAGLAKRQLPQSADNLTNRTINKKENDELEGILTEAFQGLAKVESSPVASAPAAPQPPLDQTIPKVDNVFKRAMTALSNVLSTIGNGIKKVVSDIKFTLDADIFQQDGFRPIPLVPLAQVDNFQTLGLSKENQKKLRVLGRAIGGHDKLLLALNATKPQDRQKLVTTFLRAADIITNGKLPKMDIYRGKLNKSDPAFAYAFIKGKFYVNSEYLTRGGLKKINTSLNVSDGTAAVREWSRGSNAKEIQENQEILKKIQKIHSPFIIPIRHFGLMKESKSNKTKFVAMKPKVNGNASGLREQGDRPILACLIKTALGLRDLHGAGIVHNDLKLGNILWMNDPETGELKVYLHDFDMAKKVGESMGMGTPLTMPPEYFGDEKTLNEKAISTTKVDMYSLGASILMFYFPKDLDSQIYKKRDVHNKLLGPELDNKLLDQGKKAEFFSRLKEKIPEEKKSFLGEALDLAEKLMDHDPAKRPDAKEAAKALMKIYDKIPT